MHVDESTFEQVVSAHYKSLYRFALSLTHREADACDLTQETFRRFAEKGHQVRDQSKIKAWLFTTLYREFVDVAQYQSRFDELDARTADQQPAPVSAPGERIDRTAVRDVLMQLEEPYRTPLVLFYLEDHSYKEIAEILNVPIGTVMSRISRGRELLRRKLEDQPAPVNEHRVPVASCKPQGVP